MSFWKKFLALVITTMLPYHTMAADLSANFQSFKTHIGTTIATTSVSDGANAWEAVETSEFYDTSPASTASECFFEDTAFAAELTNQGVELTSTYTVCNSSCSEIIVSACDLQTYVEAGSSVGECVINTMCRDCQEAQVNDCAVNDYIQDGWSLGGCSCGGGGGGGNDRDLTEIAMFPRGSTFEDEQVVRIYSNLPHASIYYTLDGSDPITNGTRFDGAVTLTLDEDTTITAVALANGEYSDVISYFFDFIEPVFGYVCFEDETLYLPVDEIIDYLAQGAEEGECSDKSKKSGKSDKSKKSDKSGKSDKSDKGGKSDKSGKSGKSERAPVRQNIESKVRQLVPIIPAKDPVDTLRRAADEIVESGESLKEAGGVYTAPIPICKKDLQWCEDAGYNLEKKQKEMIVIYALEGVLLLLFVIILLFAFLVAHHKRDVDKIMKRIIRLEHRVDDLQKPKRKTRPKK